MKEVGVCLRTVAAPWVNPGIPATPSFFVSLVCFVVPFVLQRVSRKNSIRRLSVRLPGFLSAAMALLASPGDEFWDDRFDALGIEGEVWAIAVMGNDVYVGGQFTKAGNVEVANIARWDGTNWWALGSGVDRVAVPEVSGVRALAVSETNLYVGGIFTRAGDVDTDGIARWDGSKWSDLGGGINGTVNALGLPDRDQDSLEGSEDEIRTWIEEKFPWVSSPFPSFSSVPLTEGTEENEEVGD